MKIATRDPGDGRVALEDVYVVDSLDAPPKQSVLYRG